MLLTGAFLACLYQMLLSGGTAFAADKSGVDPRVISLPSGAGSIEGLGESFEPGLNSGTAGYGVKIQVSPGISGFQPEVRLAYDAGYGNGPVGLSWKLNNAFIQRQTDKGLPRYQDTDTFVFSGSEEMVPIGNGFFRLKIEGSFSRFHKQGSCWESWTKDGTRHIYGETADSRMENSLGVFSWMLSRSVDTNGNEIRYTYIKDGGNIYLQEIRYGEIGGKGARIIRCEYENRLDVISDYRSRALVSTTKRLKQIKIYSESRMIRNYVLEYATASGTSLSLLRKVVMLGSDGKTALPSLIFDYGTVTASPLTVHTKNPPPVHLSGGETDLIDIDGDSLPDILYTPSTGHEVYRNLGRGTWEAISQKPQISPAYHLSTSGVLMGDLNGDGLSDLVVQTSNTFGYFKNTGKPWEKESDWIPYASTVPFSIDGPDTRLLDVNNDGLMDVVVARSQDFIVYLNHPKTPWIEVLNPGNPTGFLFTNSNVLFADMNGDRMEDLVYLDANGYIWYLPNMGYGEFGKSEVFMSGSPMLSEAKISDHTILLMDVNGDGLADLVQVDSQEISVWLNKGNNSYAAVQTHQNTPGFFTGTPELRQADMDGDGYRDLLYAFDNAPVNDAFQYVRLIAGDHPNLLTRIDNGLGQVTDITYKSSTEFMLDARDQGKPWSTVLPFPVQVVSRKTVLDKNSGQQVVTDYVYRDGYYDGVEKEFRGFAVVEQIQYGDTAAPTLKTRNVFDVGKTEESRKGLVLEQTTLTETGTADPISGAFLQTRHHIETRTLAQGSDGQAVKFSFATQDDTFVYELGASYKQLRTVHELDNYGNETGLFSYGEISGSDLAYGDDDLITATTFDYRIDDTHWMLNLPKHITQTRLAGAFVSDTRNNYDDRGNLTLQEKSPDGASWIPVIRNQYDTYGNIIKMTDANNHSRSIGYDSNFHTFPVAESIDDLNLSVSAAYDTGFGKITGFTDYNGKITGFGYDVFGRLISIVKPGDTDALPTQSFEYHLLDSVSFVKTRSRETSGASSTYDAYAYVDGLGRKLQTRSEGENGKWVVADAATFSLRGQPEAKWLPYFSDSPDYGVPDSGQPKTLLKYDAAGRVVQETNPDGSFKSTVYLPLQTEVWDEEDNGANSPHKATPHRYTNDGQDRLVRVQEQNGKTFYITQYAYDGLKNLIKIIDDHNNVKTMSFDGLGRKKSMNDPDKGVMAYQYDAAGNLTQTLDAKGQTVSYTYDAAGRVLAENAAGVKVAYHYDSDLPGFAGQALNTLGRLAWVEDEAGQAAFSYDSRGNITRKTRRTLGYAFDLQMAYDAMGRVTHLTYPDGSDVPYVYDDMNQLKAIPGYVSAIDYHPSGQKIRFQYANGLESSYGYDGRYRLNTLQTTGPSGIMQHLSYTYDTNSNIMAITDGRSQKTPESLTRSFVYDDLYQLTGCTAVGWVENYAYDSIGNMVGKTSDVADPKVNVGVMTYGQGNAKPHAISQAGPYMYQYDPNGNLISKTGQTFAFDYKDRMSTTTRQADGTAAAYRYDYTGNRVVKIVSHGVDTETTIYVDKFAEVRDGQYIQHVYAGDRRVARISKAFDQALFLADAKVLTFDDFDLNKDGIISLDEIRRQGSDAQVMEIPEVRDALKIFKEKLAGDTETLPFAVMAAACHEVGLPTQVTPAVYFYVPDHLGSSSIMTDAAGQVVEESVYYPYGMNRARSGGFEAEYRFTGKELDDENDLHYFGARYYDAMVGRFVSVDPLIVETFNSSMSASKFLNIYSYSTNPIRYVDPSGLFFQEAWGSMKEGATIVGGLVNKAQDIASEKYHQSLDWASQTKVGNAMGEVAFNCLVDNSIKNADPKTQAAYYSALAGGIDDTIKVTEKATVVAMMGVKDPSTILELGSILSDTAGGPKWLTNSLHYSSTLLDIGGKFLDIKGANKGMTRAIGYRDSKNTKKLLTKLKWDAKATKANFDIVKDSIGIGKKVTGEIQNNH